MTLWHHAEGRWRRRPHSPSQGSWPDPGDRPPLSDWHRLPRLMTSREGHSPSDQLLSTWRFMQVYMHTTWKQFWGRLISWGTLTGALELHASRYRRYRRYRARHRRKNFEISGQRRSDWNLLQNSYSISKFISISKSWLRYWSLWFPDIEKSSKNDFEVKK